MNRLYLMCSTLVVAAFLLASTAVAGDNARGKTEELVAAFKAVKSGKALTASELKSNGDQFKKIDKLIAGAAIVSATIEPHKSKLTPTELTDFKKLFWATLRNIAYPSSGEFLRQAKTKIGSAKAKGGRQDVTVHAELSEQDMETDITFHWQATAGKLQLVDVSFDGASLVLDYKNQFGRILAKKGGAGLVELLRQKNKESAAARVTNEKSAQ